MSTLLPRACGGGDDDDNVRETDTSDVLQEL